MILPFCEVCVPPQTNDTTGDGNYKELKGGKGDVEKRKADNGVSARE
jgi:hypothetical protein